MTIRVVVAEDDYLVREGVVGLLAHEADIDVVAVCADMEGLLAAADQHRPDVVVTDIRMPPTGTDEGIRAAAALRASSPEIGIVILSNYADPSYAFALLEAGAEGRAYLLKERVSDPAQIVGAVREVAAGGSVIDPKVVGSLVAERAGSLRSPVGSLTNRERDVLSQMAQGKNNAAIAEVLVVSERSVEKHINSIFAKLGLTEEEQVHRRVKAVLLHLGERGGAGTT